MPTIERLSCGCSSDFSTGRTAGAYSVRRTLNEPRCRLGLHTHAQDRVVLTLGGTFESWYRNQTFELTSREAIFRPAGVEHRDRYPRNALCLSVWLPSNHETGRRSTAPVLHADATFPAVAAELSAELDATDSVAGLALEALCAHLAGRFSPGVNSESRPARWIRTVRDIVEAKYTDPPALRDIADVVARDPCYVATAFRRAYGRSIGEYVRDLRVWHARSLLADATIPLAEVALQCGFADQSHFARIFKRRFSATPAQYRRRARGRRDAALP